tara:strand:+ start:587 stop:820 length:234 start_codon:yes stop_codon:yes gene_type:complete
MKKTQIRKAIREQISKVIKEQDNSYYDPLTTCVGRGVCCKSDETQKTLDAVFNQDHNRRITCKCPKGYRKINCSPKK